MSVFAVIEPKEEYNRQNEAAFREEVRSLGNTTYDKRGNLTVPIGKKLQFTSPTGVVVTLGFDGGNFTIQQNTSTPFSLASISYVTTIENGLASRTSALETTVNTPTTGLVARITAEELTRAGADSALASRATSLEASIDTPTTGLLARATSLESRVSTVETGKASTTVTDTIDAKIENPTTGLKARATSLETRVSTVETGKASTTVTDTIDAKIEDPTTGLKARATSVEGRVSTVENNKAEASTVTSLTARVASGDATGLIRNSRFAEPLVAGLPPGWSNWSAGTGTAVPRWVHTGGNAFRLAGGATVQAGLQASSFPANSVRGGSRFRVLIEAVLASGTYDGSGVYIDWRNAGGVQTGTNTISLANTADTSATVSNSAAGFRSWDVEVVAPANSVRANFYVMSHWETHSGGLAVANSIDWHLVDLVPVSNRVSLAEANITTLQTTTSNLNLNKAEASTVTTLSSRVSAAAGGMDQVEDFAADGLHWTTNFGGSPGTIADAANGATYVDVAGIGRCLQINTYPFYLTPKAAFKPVPGRRYRLTVRCGAGADASVAPLTVAINNVNGLNAIWEHGIPTAVAYAVPGVSASANVTVAEGFKTISREWALSGNLGIYDAAWRLRIDVTRPTEGATGGTVLIADFRVEDVTDVLAAASRGAAAEGSGLVKNSLFQVPFSGTQIPPDWNSFANGTGTQVDRTSGTGKAYRLVSTAGLQSGNQQSIPDGSLKPGRYTLRAKLRRVAGTLDGAAVYILFRNTANTDLQAFSFPLATTANTAGETRTDPDGITTWELPVTAPANTSRGVIYFMNHYSPAGSIALTNTIDWYEVDLFPVTYADVRVAAAEANITTLQSTTVDLQNNKAEASTVSAIDAKIETPTTGLKARASSLETRVTSVETGKAATTVTDAIDAKIETAGTGLKARASSLEGRVTSVETNKAEASSVTTLTAQVGGAASGSAINSSPNFADNANATGVPTNWANWTNGSGTRVTGIAPQPYAFTLAGGAGEQAGISQFRAGALTKGFYVIEADVTLNSGAFTGAGVWVDWQVATVGAGAAVVFATDPDVTGAAVGAGTTGRLYRWRKLVEVQGVPDNGHTSIYAMSHWDSHGSVASANSITWHRCAIRAASQAEIEARQAKLDLVTANAAITANQSAQAGINSAQATTNSTLSAQVVGAASGGPAINSSPSFADNANATGVPTNWTDWVNASANTSRSTGVSPQPYAITMNGVAGQQTGIRQVLSGLALPAGWYVLEADAELISGTFVGAGVFVYSQQGASDTSITVSFEVDPDVSGTAPGNGSTGKIYRWRKLVQFTHTAPNAGWPAIYATTHWNGLGSNASANVIKFHRAAIRAASQAEIEARQAKNDLVTTNANVASNTSAIASNTASIASQGTTITTNFVKATDVGVNLVPNSTGLRGRTGWEGALDWSTYEHPLWGHWFRRGFTGATVSEEFYTSLISANAGEQYSLSFVPYIAGLTSGVARVFVAFYNSGGTYIGEGANVSLTPSVHRVRQQVEAIAAPAGTAYMRFVIALGSAVGNGGYAEVGFWQAKIEQGIRATAWRADGDLINNFARLVTAEASIVTNSSAIATETSARTSADTALTANFTALRSANDADSLPSTFEKDDLFWATNASFVTESGIGRVFQATSGGHYIKTRGKIQVSLNRTYRITSRHRVKTNTTNGINPKPLTGIRGFDASGNTTGNGHWVGSFVQRTTSDGWITVSGQFTTAEILSLQAEVVSIEAYAEPNWSDLGTSNAVTQIQFLKLEDVTDIVTTNATITANQSAQAGVNSAQAATNSTLSAQVGGAASGSAINTSPSFADNANATGIPTNWYEWTNAAADGTRQTGIAPQPYAYQQAGRAGENGGVYQPMFGRFSAGWHVIEADITLVSGALTGAGVLLNADPGGVYTEYRLTFATDADVNGTVIGAGTTGQLYKFRKLVQVGRGDTYNHIYAMSHYTAFGSTASANSIKFHRVAVRAASQAEIEARQAKIDLVTANANIASNASAIATETSARAAADTTLSAKINVNGNRFPHPQPLSTTLPAGWVGTGLEVGTWQPLGGHFYYRPRSSGGSATTEYYYYDVEPTASAWVSTGEQYTLSAVGYGGAGTAGDRLLMWLEYYNSGGTMVYSSPQVLLNAYAPSERYSTTAAYTSGGEYVRRRVVFAREWAASGSYQDTAFNYIKLERGPVATAYTADGALTPLQASVTTNASAIATVNGAAAFWETIVSAGGGDLSAVRLKAGSTGSYIELISTVLRLANVSNGAVIEVMRAISGEAFFSRPISSDSASRRLTIGPGYGVSGSEVVLWFGPVATAPSSQSRTNGYFALGTDGKIYFGGTDLAVATAPMTATITGSVSNSHNDNVTPTINTSVSVTGVTNATSPYTYQWALVGLDTGSVAPELTGVTASAVGVYRGATLPVNADYGVYLSCTITDANGKQCVKHWSYVDVSTAN